MYTLDISLALGIGKSGLTDLRAQLVDTSGANVGSAVSTGFVEIGTSGNYLWHYTAFPDGHRGGVKFYSAAAVTTFLAFVAVNPEEAENVDAKVSSRSTLVTSDINSSIDARLAAYPVATTTNQIVIDNHVLSIPAAITTDHGNGSYLRNTEPDNTSIASTLTIVGTTGVLLSDGAITESKIATPAETAGRPTGILGMIRRVFEWAANKRTRDRNTGTLLLRNSVDNGTLETQTQSTAGTVDTQTKGV